MILNLYPLFKWNIRDCFEVLKLELCNEIKEVVKDEHEKRLPKMKKLKPGNWMSEQAGEIVKMSREA